MKFGTKEWGAWKFFLVVLLVCAIGGVFANRADYHIFGEHSTTHRCWPDVNCHVPTMPSATDGYVVLEDIRQRADAALGGTIINATTHRNVMRALISCAADMPNSAGTGSTHCQSLISAHANAVANTAAAWAACIIDLDAGH